MGWLASIAEDPLGLVTLVLTVALLADMALVLRPRAPAPPDHPEPALTDAPKAERPSADRPRAERRKAEPVPAMTAPLVRPAPDEPARAAPVRPAAAEPDRAAPVRPAAAAPDRAAPVRPAPAPPKPAKKRSPAQEARHAAREAKLALKTAAKAVRELDLDKVSQTVEDTIVEHQHLTRILGTSAFDLWIKLTLEDDSANPTLLAHAEIHAFTPIDTSEERLGQCSRMIKRRVTDEVSELIGYDAERFVGGATIKATVGRPA